jgi:transcriptional regulator with XRE-family HTH domain
MGIPSNRAQTERELVSDRAFTRALGEVLRRARESAGWSQAELAARMPSGLHVKTLATYEQGVRQCTVMRLREICTALAVSTSDVLARAELHAQVDLQTAEVWVNLHHVDRHARARQLRQWARSLLDLRPVSGIAHIDGDGLVQLAASFGMTAQDLVAHLEVFTIDAGPSGPGGSLDGEGTARGLT